MLDETQLIDAIYSGISEESPWQTFLDDLRELLRADSVVLFLRAPSFRDQGLLLGSGVDHKHIRRFQTKYFRDTPVIFQPNQPARTLDEMVEADVLERSTWYREFLEPSGTAYVLGKLLQPDDHSVCLLTASRGRDAVNFGALEKSLLDRISSHLSRALRLYVDASVLRSERDVFAGALNQLAIGVVILDQSGKLLCQNQLAKTLTDNAAILRLRPGLVPESRANAQAWKRLLKQALLAFERGTADYTDALRLSDGASVTVDVLARPVTDGTRIPGMACPALVLYLQKSGPNTAPSTDCLQKLFGLTPAEAKVTALLAAGDTLEEIAAKLGVKVATVRVQLKTVFGKTGLKRQPALVSHVLRSVTMLAE